MLTFDLTDLIFDLDLYQSPINFFALTFWKSGQMNPSKKLGAFTVSNDRKVDRSKAAGDYGKGHYYFSPLNPSKY